MRRSFPVSISGDLFTRVRVANFGGIRVCLVSGFALDKPRDSIPPPLWADPEGMHRGRRDTVIHFARAHNCLAGFGLVGDARDSTRPTQVGSAMVGGKAGKTLNHRGFF